MESSCAEVATILDVVTLGEWRDHRGTAFNLADAAENDLRAFVVGFEGSANFDGAAREPAYVADILQIVGEDHDRERARHLIFTEIEEVDTLDSDFHSNYFSCHAFRFADVLSGFVDGYAVGGGEVWNSDKDQRRD